jgi:hypothetical protein
MSLKEKLKQIETSIKSLEPLVLQEHYESMTEQQRNAMALAVQYAQKGLIEDAQKEIDELKHKVREALKFVVYLGVTCKGCDSWGEGISDCLDYAIRNNVQDRERCKRAKEAWKLLEELLKKEKAKP